MKGLSGEQELIAEFATEQVVCELIHSLDWSGFNSVTLERDSKNWMDVSGNLSGDGLAIVFEENGVQYVSESAPASVEEMGEALKLFLKNDEGFKRLGFVSANEPVAPLSETGYDLWKVRFEALEKQEARRRWFNVLVAVLLVGGFGFIFYLGSIGELKFLGRKTDHTSATVTSVSARYLKGGYVNVVNYEFDFGGKVYQGSFWETTSTGSFKKGDVIQVKFVVDDPSRSKMTGKFVDMGSSKSED